MRRVAATSGTATMQRRKPRVAILYTCHADESSESYMLAHYLGACLYLGSYSCVKLVPFKGGGRAKKSKAEPLPADPTELSVVPYDARKPVKITPNEDFTMGADMEVVKECQGE